jgi:galactose mutarotase-like enzyme
MNWTDKISNHAQLGGIETSVIDNGPARGTRIAWFNTGSGLRFKVVLDRAMDIADTFYNQHSLAWLSHPGITASQPFSNTGADWLKTFGGGLLTTCGLSHVGGPESDEYGQRGLHGEISNLPAELESIIQPDPVMGRYEMSITGRMKESQALGPNLELKRTISATLGSATLRIHDEVSNRGNTPAPHMILYHFNFGWPLVDEGTDIIWKGKWQPREGSTKKIFRDGNNFKRVPAPLEDHSGRGEEVAIIDVDSSVCGLHNAALGLAVSLNFKKEQLPWLINWQHWGRNEYVTGLEPATNPLVGQAKAREQGHLIMLNPGETRTYDLEINVLQTQEEINSLLANK